MVMKFDEELNRLARLARSKGGGRKGKATRRSKIAWNERNPEKIKAHNIANRKRWEKEPCSRCGAKDKVEKHHPDYLKPLVVIFLCHACHRAEHRKE